MLVSIWQLRGLRKLNLYIRKSCATPPRHRDGALTIVHRMDGARWPHRARQFLRNKTGAAADIKRALSQTWCNGVKQHAPLGYDFRRAVGHLKMGQDFFVKLEKVGH